MTTQQNSDDEPSFTDPLADPRVQFVLESRPISADLRIVSLHIPAGSPIEKTAADCLTARGTTFMSTSVGAPQRTVLSFYYPTNKTLDLSEMVAPKTLVDSRCEYHKRSSSWPYNCQSRTKIERCVDQGASSNRCDDRNAIGCGMYFVAWVPPTCRGENA